MENRYRVYRRENGIYYLEDVVTKQQESLRTRDKKKALALLVARNQAAAQPALNVTMAKAYLSGRSPELSKRNWNDVFEEMTTAYDGSTKKRFGSFARSAPIQALKRVPLIETEASHFLNALRHPRAGSSTNKWMRIVHNRALDLGWLLAPVLARKVWPAFPHEEGHRHHARTTSPLGGRRAGRRVRPLLGSPVGNRRSANRHRVPAPR